MGKQGVQLYEARVTNEQTNAVILTFIECGEGIEDAAKIARQEVCEAMGPGFIVTSVKEHAGRVSIIPDGQKPRFVGVERQTDLPGQTTLGDPPEGVELDRRHDEATGRRKPGRKPRAAAAAAGDGAGA